jgi:RNA polymerase sigma factor (sigma-70 family)
MTYDLQDYQTAARLQEKAAHGSQTATALLCSQFHAMLIAAVHKVSPHHIDEDLLAEAELAFMTAIREFDAARGIPFPAYAKIKVTSSLRTAQRREWKYQQRELRQTDRHDWLLAAIPDTSDQQQAALLRLDLAQALSGLTRQERQLIYLLYAAGDNITEAAAALHISHQRASTVKKSLLLKMRLALQHNKYF